MRKAFGWLLFAPMAVMLGIVLWHLPIAVFLGLALAGCTIAGVYLVID